MMTSSSALHGPAVPTSKYLNKNINDIKDITHFKTNSLAHKNITTFIDGMCAKIHGLGRNFASKKYNINNGIISECAGFLDKLEQLCDQTDLNVNQTGGTNRFGLAAYRDWYDEMRKASQEFIEKKLISDNNCIQNDQFKEELCHYLIDSFGNRMRIDYGTGHELNFMIFCMGLCNLLMTTSGDNGPTNLDDNPLKPESVSEYVKEHGLDLHALFSFKYIRLCRKIQAKFRLEPAGSRGVYNMDDYQFLPFLFGAAQLAQTRGISVKQFYDPELIEIHKSDYIFFEALDFIMKIKSGPFHEHSFTLWNYSGLGSWENMYKRMRSKYDDEVLSPFPIVQHLLFGKYILSWDK